MKLLTKEHILTLHKALIEEYGGTPELRDEGLLDSAISTPFQTFGGADLFEVETVKEYDASYMTCIEEAKEELHQDARPELKNYLDDISGYENIIVAGPCWWGTYPMAVFTQLDRLDFTGKKVYPVMTHEGSGLSGAPKVLENHCKGATVESGLAVLGGSAKNSKSQVEEWAKQI